MTLSPVWLAVGVGGTGLLAVAHHAAGLKSMLGLMFILAIAWFIYLFTGDAERKLPAMIAFAYVCTFAAIMLAVIAPELATQGVARPVVVGDRHPSAGVVQMRLNARERLARPISLVVAQSCLAESPPVASIAGIDTNGAGVRNAGMLPIAEEAPGPNVSAGMARAAVATPVPRCSDAQWVLNIGGWPITHGRSRPPEMRGGIAVPLYFLVLALMGGAVSLARRIPEIQKRADPSFVSTDSQQKLTPSEAREYVVFQIMQFVAAPIIAVTAYYLVNPATQAMFVTLGFVSGFASEPILLLIRGAAEKVSPT
jgi:hypothetical protein